MAKCVFRPVRVDGAGVSGSWRADDKDTEMNKSSAWRHGNFENYYVGSALCNYCHQNCAAMSSLPVQDIVCITEIKYLTYSSNKYEFNGRYFICYAHLWSFIWLITRFPFLYIIWAAFYLFVYSLLSYSQNTSNLGRHM